MSASIITTPGSRPRLRIQLQSRQILSTSAAPRPVPKTIDIKLGDTIYRFPYWEKSWTNKKSRRKYRRYVARFGKNFVGRTRFVDLRVIAQERAIAEANFGTARQELTPAEQSEYLRSREAAAKIGAPVLLLVQEAIHARLASRAKIVHKTCREIVDELLKAKRAEGAGVRWIDDLESRLNRFAENFTGSLANLSADDLNLWLTRLNLSKRSWNNNRTALLALVAFARQRKYIAPDWDAIAAIKPFRLAKPVEEIYTPEQFRSMLFTAEKHYPQHLPTLAIMGLAGCRHCELQDEGENLDWKHVHFKTRQIHIDETVAKSNTGRRWIPMQPCLVDWLKPYAKPRGPVCVVSNLTNALARIAKKAGVKYKQNALRNSFVSYRAAATQNVPLAANEAGNSVSETQKSYRRELTQEEGLAWFNIFPTRSDILPLFAHAGLD